MNIRERYKINKKIQVGETCICPSCSTTFIKNNYQQVFCRTNNGTKCKDKYWNTVTPTKRNNTTRISPASNRFMKIRDNQKDYREFFIECNYMHPHDSDNF